MKKLAALLVVSLLAGCGTAPAGAPLTSLKARPGQVRALNAAHTRVELRVPARVLGHVTEYVDGLKKEYGQEMERDMYGRPMHPKYTVKFSAGSRGDLKVVVSADGFKTTFDENGYNAGRRHEGHDVLYPFVAPAGPVSYYLEVRASVYTTGSDKLVKHLPVHYISNMGANYEGRLEAARP